MKKRFLAVIAVLALSFVSQAQVPSAEKLLPSDTLVLVSIPDFTKFRATLKESPQSQLWNDPSMKAFKDKFMTKFKADMVAPLERELGIKFSDYEGLAQGQITFAVTQNGWQGTTNQLPGWILLMDTKDKSATLKTNLANVKKKWVDSGKQLKTEKIRDVEFTTLITSTDDIFKMFDAVFPDLKKDSADAEEKKPGTKLEILVGQSGSLLLVGNSAKVMEKILVQQAGGLAPALMSEAAYESQHNAMFRDAPLYIWLNVKPFVEVLTKQASSTPSENPLMPQPEKIVSASGIGGLKTIAFSYRTAPEGTTAQISLGIPEAQRAGIFKMLVAETKESSPPAFVPADATKFTRWRLNLPKAWTSLETMLTDISPAVGGAFSLIFESAGKDKDPNYDLKKELLGNLGDDFIHYQKKPASSALADLDSPPSIFLLGSPAPEKLASALKIGMSLLSPTPVKEREFLGRKIYTIPPSPLLAADPKMAERSLSFSASGGYVALSTTVSVLEEYLRSSDTKAKALSETAGLSAAAEKVGGMGSGLFGFNNEVEQMRATFNALKSENTTLSDLLKTPKASERTPEDEKKINEWADFSLLPSFDSVSKYFHYSVYGGSFNANGFTIKFFHPAPPLLNK